MKTIPVEAVEENWGQFNVLSPEEVRDLVDRMAEQQPAIIAYLFVEDENSGDPDGPGTLLSIGFPVVKLMLAQGGGTSQITTETLTEAEDANLKFLEQLDDEPELRYADTVSRMMSSYNQMPLLNAVLEALMQGHEEQPELAPENIGLIWMQLKTVIDCLDR